MKDYLSMYPIGTMQSLEKGAIRETVIHIWLDHKVASLSTFDDFIYLAIYDYQKKTSFSFYLFKPRSICPIKAAERPSRTSTTIIMKSIYSRARDRQMKGTAVLYMISVIENTNSKRKLTGFWRLYNRIKIKLQAYMLASSNNNCSQFRVLFRYSH